MAKGLTPIIGLAVVVALALAAVFGAMSLTNPAFAAIGQPADAELTERVDSPQSAPNLTVEGMDGQVKVSWPVVTVGTESSTDSGFYEIRWRSEDEVFTRSDWVDVEDASEGLSSATSGVLDPPTPVSVVVGGLENDKLHYFQVRVNVGGDRTSPGTTAEATATPSEPPEKTDDLTVTAGARQATLQWDDPGDNSITGWQYLSTTTAITGVDGATTGANAQEFADQWKGISGSSASTTSHVVRSLVSGQTYYFAVRAVAQDTPGLAAISDDNTSQNYVSAQLEPGVVGDFEAKPGNGQVTLEWKPTSDAGVFKYQYRYKKTSDQGYSSWSDGDLEIEAPVEDPVLAGNDLIAANAKASRERSEVDVEDLDNDVSYTFQLRAVATSEDLTTTSTAPAADNSVTREDESTEAMAVAVPVLPTASTLKEGGIPNIDLLVLGQRMDVNLIDYYNSGAGSGAIEEFTVDLVGDSVAITGLSGEDDDTTGNGMISLVGIRHGLAVITVTATDDNTDLANPMAATFTVMVGDEAAPVVEIPVPKGLPTFSADSSGAGSTTHYTIQFQLKDADDTTELSVNTRQYDLIIEFHEDYGIPSSIGNTSVAMTTERGTYPRPNGGSTNTRTFTPEDVTVDGSEVFISLGDMDEQDDRFDYEVEEGEVITVLFRQSAGISNPTAADDYDSIVKITFGGLEIDNEDGPYTNLAANVPHSISIDPEDGGLGEVVTVKAKGFKNGTSVTVFRDMAEDSSGMFSEKLADQKLTSEDDVLCTDPVVEDNIGTCTFEVTHPTFSAGVTNIINAVDGVNATAAQSKTKNFELKSSLLASPSGGSPGEMILVQVVDFEGSNITKVTIGGETYCDDSAPNRLGDSVPCGGGVDSQGSGSFSIEIPNWARGGLQELKVWDNVGTSASTKISLVGPQIRLTRETVVANQRISLIGTGFSPRSVIANVEDLAEDHTDPMISIGGETIDEERINDGDPVRVDNGGNWSASVDLPLSEATTAAGNREIRVRDSLARIGVVNVVVVDRVVTVTPEEGRVGTISVVRGEGFPSKNDEGSNFTVEIEYEAANGNAITVSALTDASGRFEQQLRIPTTAAIPSSNQIHVRFDDDDDVTVSITVPHEVPEGIIQPSATSGGPGSLITVSGEGFKSFVPVSLVKIGTLDVTPAPKPSTDGNGMMEFDITIPGLDVGIQTIEVNVGRTTASVGFTVTESGINPGNIVEVGPGLEDLGDNFVNIWNFNNDTKAWSFYDGQEGSDLTHLITGETYLLQIKSTVEVILNRDTRNLTCVGDNCWNQIVW